jgi:GTP diphosphokinase / guanosine-3',5'-bis(diphosphate) 3'-diphosphatase
MITLKKKKNKDEAAQLFAALRSHLDYLDPLPIKEIEDAFLIAEKAHHGQKRASGETYLTHPIAVAIILADMQMDHQSIIAALLHDVIEDTSVTKKQIIAKFGKIVAELVDGVTKLTQIESQTKAEAQADSFRKMVLAMSQDIRVILIKLADRLHNIKTLGDVDFAKRKRIARETLDIYAPIANRLGMHLVASKLENLAFTYFYPRRSRILEEALKKNRGNRKEIMQTIEKNIKTALAEKSLSAQILGREKHLYGIYRKMQKKHISFANIMDVYAFRIIVKSLDDCYRALGIIHNLYKPVPGKFKDYIAIPKYNGYQSLHTTLFGSYGIPLEIQIRTEEMEHMANNGIAAHWIYKSGDQSTDSAHIRAQQWVNNLLEMQQNTGSSLEFIENVKIDLFPDEVYVFTPKGHIMELPKGSTVIDFAYAVHTDVGNTCVAARIDHQFMSLATVLSSGQTISIITAPGAKPNPAWLNFVATAKARSGIRGFLKGQQRGAAIELGKQLLQKSLSSLSSPIEHISQEAINSVLQKAKLASLDDLYEDIGLGNRLAIFVAHQLVNIVTQKDLELPLTTPAKPLLIRGAEGMSIIFATCCSPIPGDLITGYFNIGHGLVIHTEDCPNLAMLRKHAENCVPVKWADDVGGEFKAEINTELSNQRGVLASVAKAISDVGSNIENIRTAESSGEYQMVTITLSVRNTNHLERILRHLSNLPGVIGVIRKR